MKKEKVNTYLLSNTQATDHLGIGHIIKKFYQGMTNLGHPVQIIEPQQYIFSSENTRLQHDIG